MQSDDIVTTILTAGKKTENVKELHYLRNVADEAAVTEISDPVLVKHSFLTTEKSLVTQTFQFS